MDAGVLLLRLDHGSLMKILVSIGHWPEKPGHSGPDWSEYSLLAPVAGFCIRELERLGHDAWIGPAAPLGKKIEWERAARYDLAVELHANADPDPDGPDDPVASGCEVLYFPNSASAKDLAAKVSALLAAGIGEKDRGAKPGYLANGKPAAWVFDTRSRALIVEFCFLDDVAGLEKIRTQPELLGVALARALVAL